MKAEKAIGFFLTKTPRCVSAATRVVFSAKPIFSRLSPTRSLRIEQSPARQEQIRERRADLQSVQVLRQASITDLLKADDPLDHPKDVFDLGTHAGLAAVARLDRLVNAFSPPIALVGKVVRSGCAGVNMPSNGTISQVLLELPPRYSAS
jgi:hypothetical protein